MKKLIYLPLLALAFSISSAALAHADDQLYTITKAGEGKAKIAPVANSKGRGCVVPIRFDDGASWDNVKDVYNISDETAGGFKGKKESLSIGSDGTATFHHRK